MKKARFWYTHNNKNYLVPSKYVYRINEKMGGGCEILAPFFSDAFALHNISIVKYRNVFADQTSSSNIKDSKISAVRFIVECIGQDKETGRVCSGLGEANEDSITQYQKKYPYSLAAKRAKVNMGKEFFGLTDLRLSIDYRDAEIPVGKEKGQPIEEVYSENPQKISWYASDEFKGNEIFKMKVKEFLDSLNHLATKEQMGELKSLSKQLSKKTIKIVAANVLGDFNWKYVTQEEADNVINQIKKQTNV